MYGLVIVSTLTMFVLITAVQPHFVNAASFMINGTKYDCSQKGQVLQKLNQTMTANANATSDQTKKTTDIGTQVMMIASACGLK
jgi:hypothetical protein